MQIDKVGSVCMEGWIQRNHPSQVVSTLKAKDTIQFGGFACKKKKEEEILYIFLDLIKYKL